MYILGISAFYHDSAAALIKDGLVIAAAQEERFSRIKHDSGFPKQAIRYCLEEAGISVSELKAVVFYDKPLLKFERLLETYYAFAPKGVFSFLQSMPVWLNQKLFLKKTIRKELNQIDPGSAVKIPLYFPEHHLSHAASAFFCSPYEEAAILTVDGVGEWATTTICKGNGNSIEVLQQMNFPDSVGLLYSAFTFYLGFRVNSGEYKLMGLAPYGNPESEQTRTFRALIRNKLIKIYEDGSLSLDQQYFSYAVGLKMVDEKAFKKLFGFDRRLSDDNIEQHHCNLALAIQQVTEEIILKLSNHAKKITGCRYLCLAGGVALNCVANGKIQNEHIFESVFVQPAAGDAGGALGAALSWYYIGLNKDRKATSGKDLMMGALLGPSIKEEAIRSIIRKYQAVSVQISNQQEFNQTIAALLAEGKIVGWVQGRMEFGPRALGNRSILGDPRDADMQKKMNLKIKFREGFRPFAPAILAEEAHRYFQLETPSPYMLFVQSLKKEWQKSLPENYEQLNLNDKLYYLRSDFPAITHVDFSARIQTVEKETNPAFYELLRTFQNHTGCPMLVNTSFNVRGEPLVCTPEDAYRCFMRTDMDILVIENYIFRKEQQPYWKEDNEWKKDIQPD